MWSLECYSLKCICISFPSNVWLTFVKVSYYSGKKDVPFNIGDWNAKVGSQEIPEVTGKFGLEVQKETGQKLTEFCQQNTLIIANTLFLQYKK